MAQRTPWSPRRALVAGAASVLIALPLLAVPAAAGAGGAGGPSGGGHGGGGHGGGGPGGGGAVGTYTNPVSAGFADTYADPAVVRGQDGWWYAYGTTDPLREGEGTRHLLPVSRSADLVTWEYVGDAFTEATLPTWADTDPDRLAALWAPDVRYVDGEYRLYYVVTQTTLTPGAGDGAIGVATAPTPTGPWTDSGDPVVDPRPGGGGPDDFLWTFDPHHVVGPDGTEHLFYGSYYGGIWVTELDATGTEAVGTPTRVAVDNKFEGAYVVQRDGFWYLFASTANCCAGPTTGYSVQVGRATDLTGPYLDREGVPLDGSRAGGTPVLTPNGNAWVGTGHNAVATDLAGQDWIVYHAIDRADPYLDGTDGVNERPMLIDRLDWVDGWPVVNGGAGASEGEQTAPVTDGRAVTGFDAGTGSPFRGASWRTEPTDPQGGPHAVSRRAGALLTREPQRGPVRVEADVRLDGTAAGGTAAGGVVAGQAGSGRGDRHDDADWSRADGGRGGSGRPSGVSAVVDPGAGLLVLRSGSGEATAPLPPGVDWSTWHAVVLELDGRTARAEVSQARLGDPLAAVALDLPRRVGAGSAGAVARGAGVHVDDLSVVPLAGDDVVPVPLPTTGTLTDDVTFDADLGAGWTALRAPEVTVADGALVWPVERADLTGSGNDAGVLLRAVPDGDWTAETQVTTDLGVDDVRNYQQAGLVAYGGDDLFARLSHVAIWNTRQTELGYETPYAGRLAYGGTIVGPPGDTTWLRLVHRTDDTGEHEVRGLTSTDGSTWVAGGVWTFPAGTDLRVGLVAHGWNGTDPRATARFEHLRIWAD